ncbi:MAG TPA: 50S ribosomal protein L3 [Polyangiaceae bacterium]
MNTHPGVIGRKLGMTQVFAEDGSVVPCTVVEASSIVVGKRTLEKDGYDALVLGMGGDMKEGRANKPLAGQYKKSNLPPKAMLRELRCTAEFAAGFEIGHDLKIDQVFEAGQFVDVRGITRGRGFTGVMRRHNFSGYRMTHGTHEYRRHGGSIGTRMTPGRVKLGQKMPGHYGNETVSILSQPIVKVLPEQNAVLIRGGIPGARGGLVTVRGAVKRAGGKNTGEKRAPEKKTGKGGK